ncbi:MarR family transcriptional regulator [Micromonospora sp. NPDC050686]|uniref:MarR family winged helix-turn-helix transcriptional regulator n=1 Tax=Micromonospora sp. NPDC050686 TaxID=3154631 RepID=UPI0033DE6753
MTAAPPPDEPEPLAELFWEVARGLRQRSREALEPWQITPAQGRALQVLMRHGAIRLGGLAEHLRIAPRSATEVVDQLEQRGLVERRPDPQDRRATLVAPTPEGTRVGGAVRDARTAAAQRLFGELSAADRADLARVLRTLAGDPRDAATGPAGGAPPRR